MSNALAIRDAEFEELEPAHVSDGRVPPHDLDAEAAVLSALMIDPEKTLSAVDFLEPVHFYSNSHQRIFQAALNVAEKKGAAAIDIVEIGTDLKLNDRIDEVGGMAYLTEILNCAPAVGNVRAYASTVYDRFRLRQMIGACQKIAAQGYLEVPNEQQYLDEAARELLGIAAAQIGRVIESNVEALKRVLRNIAETMQYKAGQKQKAPSVMTGLRAFDETTGGIWLGETFFIASVGGGGKTAWVLQLIRFNCSRGVGVYFWSTEMSRDQILLRLVASEAGVSVRDLRAGELTNPQWARVVDASNRIAKWPLEIDERCPHIEQIKADTRAAVDWFQKKWGVALAINALDYVQNIPPAPRVERKSRHEQVAYSSKEFVELNKRLNLAGIQATQQANLGPPDPKTGERPMPTKMALAESPQALQAVAHGIAFLHRAGEEKVRGRRVFNVESKTDIRLVIAKQRSGEEVTKKLRFDGPTLTFFDVEGDDDDDEC